MPKPPKRWTIRARVTQEIKEKVKLLAMMRAESSEDDEENESKVLREAINSHLEKPDNVALIAKARELLGRQAEAARAKGEKAPKQGGH